MISDCRKQCLNQNENLKLKAIVLIVSLTICFACNSQLNYVEILIVWTDSEVTHYMDSLKDVAHTARYHDYDHPPAVVSKMHRHLEAIQEYAKKKYWEQIHPHQLPNLNNCNTSCYTDCVEAIHPLRKRV